MLTAPFIFFVMCLKSHVMSRQRNFIAQTLTTVSVDRHKDVTIADGNRPLWFFTHDNHIHNMGCIESFFPTVLPSEKHEYRKNDAVYDRFGDILFHQPPIMQ